MPRTARASIGGLIYHALNRGNRREAVFHKPADYDAFVEARRRLPVDLFGFCLMPNHFHFVLRPHADGDLGRWMRWLLTAHARRYHRHYKTTGHVWQGRYKAFPIQDDDHLATVLRYVERNPLRAGLVARAEHWKWSSLPGWLADDPSLWRGAPSSRGPEWVERVNEPLSAGDLRRLRASVDRERPFGSDDWTDRTAAALGLESTLRGRGRPKKAEEFPPSPFAPPKGILSSKRKVLGQLSLGAGTGAVRVHGLSEPVPSWGSPCPANRPVDSPS